MIVVLLRVENIAPIKLFDDMPLIKIVLEKSNQTMKENAEAFQKFYSLDYSRYS
jgi:hypothetical protein